MKSHENHQNHDAAERNLLFHALEFEIFPLPPYKVEGERGGGEQGGERCTGGGKEGAGSGRKREKLCIIAQYFANEKLQRGGSQQILAGTGIKGYGKWEV